ncbi:MAG: nucleotidyltransferase domain-containing protein [bacterium]|nr:MAG: nucleotidyltransferase domain-containing protein [bacterium]
MSKIPKIPDEVFQEITDDFKKTFGDDLITIILYGSAARGEYIYKKSDINFLIVLSEQGIQQLRNALSLIPKWNKKKVSTPLVLTRKYIQSALDSFPIEFLTMKQHYQVVYGEDVLSEIEIKPEHLRLQCERELRGKLLHLREGYLNTNGKTDLIKRLIRFSLPAFASIFSALIHLKNVEVPGSKQQIFIETANLFNLDSEVFKKILNLEAMKPKLSKEQINHLLEQYIDQIHKLTNIVDEL